MVHYKNTNHIVNGSLERKVYMNNTANGSLQRQIYANQNMGVKQRNVEYEIMRMEKHNVSGTQNGTGSKEQSPTYRSHHTEP